eukprot:GHVL01014279.1.p1 GENE.GHVL01014279.1~~GHVL01014279.1.p1  ORF type:complete len:611 (-),score=62.55 GHVL01014279.1:1146-2978(-)
MNDLSFSTFMSLMGKKSSPIYRFRNQRLVSVWICSAMICAGLAVSYKAQGQVSSTVRRMKNYGQKLKAGLIDKEFFSHIYKILRVAVPSWVGLEAHLMIILSCSLILRSFLSIWIATVNGSIVRSIVDRSLSTFLRRLFRLTCFAIPASIVNAAIEYLSKLLAIRFRKNLTNEYIKRYTKNLIFYKMSICDSRIPQADQRLTQDVDAFSTCLSTLFSNLAKPLLDIVLFSKKLSDAVGPWGPIVVMTWYSLSGFGVKLLSPPIGQLTAENQELEGEYRALQSSLVRNAEEIAFYRGHMFEKGRLMESLELLLNHARYTSLLKFIMSSFDNMFVKYGAAIIGYAVVAMPVFGPPRYVYAKKSRGDSAKITQDYVRNSALLINLAKAIGRLFVSYKDVQQLAGYTFLLSQLEQVLCDLENKKYVRSVVETEEVTPGGAFSRVDKMVTIPSGTIIEGDYIRFRNVPIISPNGTVLIENLDIQINQGMNVFFTGPNGCGKSSFFRILGGLWPVFEGEVTKPPPNDIFYIPQRPYMPVGTLRDQVQYPDESTSNDILLRELLILVDLEHILNRFGWNHVDDWMDLLSGGEKQRIAMARLFYHKPKFAILEIKEFH